jgi:hypothetical protein
MRAWAVAAAVLALPVPAVADFTQTFTQDPHPGIHRETWKDASIPAVVRVIRVDLTNSSIQLVATSPDHRGMTTSAYSSLEQAAVAINGDSFSVADFQPTGLAMGLVGGQPTVWPGTADDGTSAVFDYRSTATPTTGEYTLAELVPTGLVVTPDMLPTGTLGVVSGRPLLVRDRVAIAHYDCNDPLAIPCVRAPRSALALSNNGNSLWLVAVDGWQSTSAGLTDAELATFLQATFSVDMAMALDGGSSSTLVVDGSVVSNPSDGVERTVANHLAVQFQPVKSGAIVGSVCRKTFTPCNTPIAGATLTLDNGKTATAASSGSYLFTGLTPRYTCVTATATNYHSIERCVVVGPGPNPTYDSIAMQPCPSGGCPPVDAAVPDAAVHYPDASALVDGGPRDGGNPEMGPGGGCCQSGSNRPPLAAVLGVLAVWWLARRRGTVA